MCFSCHDVINEEELLKSFNEILKPNYDISKFKIYNSTSLHHLFISASGWNGNIVKEKSIKVLEKYTCWLKNNSSEEINSDFNYTNLNKNISYLKNSRN